MASVSADASGTGLEQTGMNDAGMFRLSTVWSKAWAKDRAAELVGMKWEEDKLVPNPDAAYRIDETTRDSLRILVERATDEGWSPAVLAKEIRQSYAFSKERAETIARTETAKADLEGLKFGWKASGIVSGMRWRTAPLCCDACLELNMKAVALDGAFTAPDGTELTSPPLHPNCRCSLTEIFDDDPEAGQIGKITKINHNHDPRDGRFTSNAGALLAGPAPVDIINKTLGTNFDAGSVRFSAKTHHKIKVMKHAPDYAAVRKNLSRCLRNPDFIGVDPRHPGRISLVKRVSGLSGGKQMMIVPIETTKRGGFYHATSAYGLNNAQFERRFNKGWLKKAKAR